TLRVLVSRSESVLICPPTFGMYRFVAEVNGAPVTAVERREDFSIDVEAVRAAVTERTALIIVASPNNPTGNVLSAEELSALLATGATVVVDEAYGEFAGSSFIGQMGEQARLVVLRTFSKWAGLAGLRVGFGVFPPSVAEVLLRIKQPYNVNRAAEAAALSALAQPAELEQQVRTIAAARDELSAQLSDLGWLRPYPSAANFLLCEVQGGAAPALQEALARRGVFVRHFSTPRLEGCLRISVPRPDQTPSLLERLRAAGAELGLERG
ncbi:MAG: aminotransferase class I/II-fold pyridoxal phosphate-dependent enzyme, partial [Dehalococcoidia bacterium]